MKDIDQVLCLNVFGDMTCDKLFLIPRASESSVTGNIIYEQDKEDPLSYSFHIADKIIKNGEITHYEWKVNNIPVSTDESFVHHFSMYGDAKILLVLTDSAGNTTELTERLSIRQPLKLTK